MGFQALFKFVVSALAPTLLISKV